MKWLRLLFLAIGLAALLAGLFCERHEIQRLDGGAAATLGGATFVAGTAVDDFMLKDGALYKVNSLSPNAASAKDCKT
ncbi:MAG: hypothetical protein ABSE73_29490 [Planctomycetota bacterium]